MNPCLYMQNKLGGGEGIEGLYGSITQSGMQKVLECMRHNAALDPGSVLVDIGAGLGRCVCRGWGQVGWWGMSYVCGEGGGGGGGACAWGTASRL